MKRWLWLNGWSDEDGSVLVVPGAASWVELCGVKLMKCDGGGEGGGGGGLKGDRKWGGNREGKRVHTKERPPIKMPPLRSCGGGRGGKWRRAKGWCMTPPSIRPPSPPLTPFALLIPQRDQFVCKECMLDWWWWCKTCIHQIP